MVCQGERERACIAQLQMTSPSVCQWHASKHKTSMPQPDFIMPQPRDVEVVPQHIFIKPVPQPELTRFIPQSIFAKPMP